VWVRRSIRTWSCVWVEVAGRASWRAAVRVSAAADSVDRSCQWTRCRVAVHITSPSSWGRCDGVIGRSDVCVLTSPRVTEPRRGLFLPHESLPFCRLSSVVSAVFDRRRHLSYVVVGAAIVPFPWPGSTNGHCCRSRIVFRRSPGASSPSPESRITHFLLLTVFFYSWAILLPKLTSVSWTVLWANWLFTELLYLRTFPVCGVQPKDIFCARVWLYLHNEQICFFIFMDCWIHVYCLILSFLCAR